MSKPLLGRLAFAMMPALIMLTAMTASPAAAVVNIDTCQRLEKFGATYRVTQDLSSCDTDCLVVANDRITIDLQGHQIVNDCPNTVAGITDAGIARDSITVRNGSIEGFDFGVNLTSSTRSRVRNVTAIINGIGISAGDKSLVKGSTAISNSIGIRVGERSQVEGNDASGNGTGISAGNHCLVTRNTASFNGDDGIATGGFCTVTFNTANDNNGDGIDVGADGAFDGSHSLVSRNTAINNGDVGVQVQCPSTVTFNNASANAVNYNLFGARACHSVGNQE